MVATGAVAMLRPKAGRNLKYHWSLAKLFDALPHHLSNPPPPEFLVAFCSFGKLSPWKSDVRVTTLASRHGHGTRIVPS